MSVTCARGRPPRGARCSKVGLLDDRSIGRKAKISRRLAPAGGSYRSVTLSRGALRGTRPVRVPAPRGTVAG